MFHIHFCYVPYTITLNCITLCPGTLVAISSAYEIKTHYFLFVAVASLNPKAEEHKPPKLLDTNKGMHVYISYLYIEMVNYSISMSYITTSMIS